MTVLGKKLGQGNTFVIRIVRTDRGTWQGEAKHVRTGKTYTFASCLEMLLFMNKQLDYESTEDKANQLKKLGAKAGLI